MFRIEVDGEEDEVAVPADAVDLLSEDESAAEMAADLVMLGFSQQVHAHVHHAQGSPEAALQEAEADVMEAFEERFGTSFGQVTGHDH